MAIAHDYTRAVEGYDYVTGLYPLVLAAKAFRRKHQVVHPALRTTGRIPVVDRDGVVIALVNKALTTHAAIKLLTDGAFGSDAKALVRVLLENVVLLEWLMLKGTYRIELYAESDELHTRHLAELVTTHYSKAPEMVQTARKRIERHAAALKQVFGDTQKKWARRLAPDGWSLSKTNVSLEEMFKELSEPTDSSPDGTRKSFFSFMQEVMYFEGSGYVHTTMMALRKLANGIANQQYFSVTVHQDDETDCAAALSSANIMALGALADIDDYAGLGLQDKIAEGIRLFGRDAGSEFD